MTSIDGTSKACMSVGTVAAGASRLWPKRLNCPQDAHDYLFWNEISRPATSILFVALPICGLIRRLDAHHMRPTQALELQRLALDRIKVRSLAGFDGDVTRVVVGPFTSSPWTTSANIRVSLHELPSLKK